MNRTTHAKDFLAAFLLLAISLLLAGCHMTIVPTQYDCRLTSKTKEIVAEHGGQSIEIAVLVDSSRFDDLSSEENNTFLSYHVYTEGGELLDYDGRRSPLEKVPARGKKTEEMSVVAPLEAGSYTIEVDLVEEGVTWFSKQGMPTLKIPLTVLETGELPL